MSADTETDATIKQANQNPISIRSARHEDLHAIADTHRRALGPGRFALTAYRVREGTPPISDYCQVAECDNKLLAAVRFTQVSIGGQHGALLLGPLAVDPDYLNKGFGRALIDAGIATARKSGVQLVVLVGDSSYYGRLGFLPVPPGQIEFPGPVNPARILAMELSAGALTKFSGALRASTQ